MNLVIDLGNTNIVLGFYRYNKLEQTFRLQTDKQKSEDEYITLLKVVLKGIKITDVEKILISSVVPSLNFLFEEVILKVFKKEPLWLKPGVRTGLKINIDNPLELGADLIAGVLGAKLYYKSPLIVVDFGTASKFSVVDASGAYVGCLILPGIKLSSDALRHKASQLGEVSFHKPKRVIGKNTADSMNSGIINGTGALVDGLVKRIEGELGYPCRVLLTGGLAKFIYPALTIEAELAPNLVLDGLNEVVRLNYETR